MSDLLRTYYYPVDGATYSKRVRFTRSVEGVVIKNGKVVAHYGPEPWPGAETVTMRRSFRRWVILLAVLILATVAATVARPDPMTDDQAVAWVNAHSIAEVAHKIAVLDAILQAEPVVNQQPQLFVLQGRDLVVSGGVTTLELPFGLWYTITPDTRKVVGFAPPDRSGEVLVWKIVAAVGAVVAAVLGGIAGHALK